MGKKDIGISNFERFLTIWVSLAIVVGIAIGKFIPSVPVFLSNFEYANVSIPIAILIWIMIFPMMLKVDFTSIKNHIKAPKGLTITVIVNWLIKPFTMFLISSFFFFTLFKNIIPESLGREYLAGAVLLGVAPCTAMVFVWSHLTKGNPSYTVLQVAVNDLIILVAFAPIAALLLGISNVKVPFNTLLLSVGLFVVVPLFFSLITRRIVIKKKGMEHFKNVFLKRFDKSTISGLLLTLVIIFSFQGDTILNNKLHILLIAIPLVVQTVLIFFVGYLWAKVWKCKHEIAAPAALIGSSNFFELAVAVAIALFGLDSGAALATVVGVLVEVPVMLALVAFANRTRSWFKHG